MIQPCPTPRPPGYPGSDLRRSRPAGATLDKAGNLYGNTSEGGRSCSGLTCGTVYELVPSSGGYSEKQLYLFTGAGDGSSPFGGVIFDSSGNLYGSQRTQV